jgi:hypothetical protein
MVAREGTMPTFAHRLFSVLSPQSSVLRLRVRDAWLAHERYKGRRVAIVGVVRVFEEGTPDEYFALDDGPQRVGLRGDATAIRALIGRRVRAVGTITYKPGDGIFLIAERIEPRR